MTELIVITGPTASGKTRRAVALARDIHSEIISADSRQIYRGMDLGTGKDIEEYGEVPVHMIDICPAGYKYNLFEYLRDADRAMADIRGRGMVPIVCGGTGLYVEAILNGLHLPEVPANPDLRARLEGLSLDELTAILAGMKQLHNTTDIDTAKRAIRAIEIADYYTTHPVEAQSAQKNPVKNSLIIGVDIDRDSRRSRISERLRQRFEAGMLDEVKALLDSGIAPEDLIYYGLEYKFMTQYLINQLTYREMYEGLETAIHQFAKRQMTWFRGMERRGFKIHWLDWRLSDEEFVEAVRRAEANTTNLSC